LEAEPTFDVLYFLTIMQQECSVRVPVWLPQTSVCVNIGQNCFLYC